MNYYRRFPGDYLRDTMHLSMAEDGAFGRMLDWYYANAKPLPLDRAKLYTITRANSDADKKAVESVLRQFFKKTRYGFTNRRAKKEIVRTKEISSSRSSAGKQKGKKSANAEQKQEISSHNPESRFHIPDKEIKSSAIDDLKHSILSKSQDPDGMIAAMLEIICERAERSGTTIHTEAYLMKALDNFNTEEGQDREELLQRMRRGVN